MTQNDGTSHTETELHPGTGGDTPEPSETFVPETDAPATVDAEAPPAPKKRTRAPRKRATSPVKAPASSADAVAPPEAVAVASGTEAPAATVPATQVPAAQAPAAQMEAIAAEVAEPAAEEEAVEEDVVEEDVVEPESPLAEPVAETPAVRTPALEAFEAPVVEAPVAGAPVTGTPVTEVPVEEAAPKRTRRRAVAPAMPLFQAPPAEPEPRRARRSASRPAGPPVAPEPGTEPEAVAASVEAPATAPFGAPAAVSTDTAPEGEATSRESAPERPRRSRSRRASRPVAEPSPEDELQGLAASVTEGSAQEQVAPDADETARVENSGVEVEDDETENETEEEAAEGEDNEGSDGPRRRRRRGGRGRRGRSTRDADDTEAGEESVEEEPTAETAEAEDEDAAGEPDDVETSESGSTSSGTRRRRRRRRGAGGGSEAEPSPDDPPNTVVRVREPRQEVTGVRGSTRLEAKKQRRREGRDQGRRKNVITEAEFLARRESVDRTMLVRQLEGRTQIAVLEDDVLVEHYVARQTQTSTVGNVYLGKVQNVLPSMEAAFVDIGKGRNAVLYAGEVNWDAAGLDGQPRRIEHALKAGESVLVQVTKDPIGHKGARLTSQISLAGRYLVYVPDGSMTGISRKLPDTERARLKRILKGVVPEDAGVIVRTAAEGASEDELERDVQRLQGQWEEIEAKTAGKAGNAGPTLLHGEPDLAIRVVRDIFNEDFSSLVISGDEAWDQLQSYIGSVAPHLVERATRWEGERDVFAAHRVDEQLAKGLDRKVWLPSGGSLVIDRTEAMTVVDVNTGKFTGSGGNLEETVTRNNLEAAEEVVRQLRLRDIGGIIVVDFIDMVLESNRELVQRRLMECLGRDRTRHQVAEVTSLGLVQMTRKRVGQGLLEVFSENCEHCNGRGVIVHDEPVEKKQPGGNGGGNSGGGNSGGNSGGNGGGGNSGGGNGGGGSGSSGNGGGGNSGGGGGRKRSRGKSGGNGDQGPAESSPPPVVRNPEAISQIAAVAGAASGG